MEHHLKDDTAIVSTTAKLIHEKIRNALNRGVMRVVLGFSGGTGPKALYEQLAHIISVHEAVQIDIIQVDERVVSIEHEDSNQRLIRTHAKHMLDHKARLHAIPMSVHIPDDCTVMIDEIAYRYDTLIEPLFDLNGDKNVYSLAVLGVGFDGHTASIFPNASLEEQNRAKAHDTLVFASTQKHVGYYRISLTYKALSAFDTVIMYVPGIEKKVIVEEIVSSKTIVKYPASFVLHSHHNSMLISSCT